ncbi:DUF2231 domain-containing protein [Rhodoflexus caldus]|uniref:DUF2231 domain-containing protein n=1 Tax=Rhodoflexus caldus TaxID=2891236 RepID=UPI00202ABD1D|nr:DUF2231 domain-containing protein [Rhodoflexus caldus]
MNGAHFHLVVNHLPIIFPMAGIIVLLVGFFTQSEAVKRTSYLLFIIGAISAGVAMASGEGAEEVVEKIGGIAENFIHRHEEAAELFAILSYILGGLSLASLWASWKQKPFAAAASVIVLIFAFVVLFFAKQTGTTGGEIRHTEIRDGSNAPANDGSSSEKEHDD